MRIAVTGATGFVGGRIAKRLAEGGHEVVALGRRPRRPAGLSDAMEYRAWDLGDASAAAPPELGRVDAVVHAAAHVADWGPDSPFQIVTVQGTERLLAAVAEDARVVIVGSASVYDPFRGHDRAREDEAPVGRYRNAYGRAKAAQERVALARRPDAIVLRPRCVYGSGDTTLLPRLVAARRHGRLLLPAGGRHSMSVTHVDTVADAVAAALGRPGVRGPVNVADVTPVVTAELLRDLFAALDLPTRIVDVRPALAWIAAAAAERLALALGRRTAPAITTYAVSHLVWPFTLDLSRLHAELGIRPDRHYGDSLPEVAAGVAAGARRRVPLEA